MSGSDKVVVEALAVRCLVYGLTLGLCFWILVLSWIFN